MPGRGHKGDVWDGDNVMLLNMSADCVVVGHFVKCINPSDCDFVICELFECIL